MDMESRLKNPKRQQITCQRQVSIELKNKKSIPENVKLT
ncbi:hypothetical protein RF55_23153, partial [Lasius niger]